jgi:hypothetical protein
LDVQEVGLGVVEQHDLEEEIVFVDVDEGLSVQGVEHAG